MNTEPDPSASETKPTSNASASKAEISALQAELAVQKDRYLRLATDFDNFRKRIARETERSAVAQKEAFIRELLPVIDNLERALASDVSTSPEQLREGVQMTLQQLMQLLLAHGVEPEASLGRPVDPRYHEAVSVRHDPSQPDHVVLETLQRGYRRGSEVFRPAKVVVNVLTHAESTPDTV
jgi:molecular chaperone GrpE